jgi:hypothetical protein
MLTLLFISTLLLTSRASDEATVTIPCAARTLPEIATALSVEGRKVVCGAGVRDRGAVICLRSRSWSDACRAVEQGLDLRIRPHPDLPNTWLMEGDPEVTARETKLRSELAKVIEQAVAREIAPYRSSLNVPIHVLAERSLRLEQALALREKTDPEHKDPVTRRLAKESEALQEPGNPFNQVAARLATSTTRTVYEQAIRSPQAFRPVDIHRMANIPAICSLMLAEMACETEERISDSDAGSRESSAEDSLFLSAVRRVAAGEIAVWQSVRFDPPSLKTTVQQVYFIAGAHALRNGITVSVVDELGEAGLLRGLRERVPGPWTEEAEETVRWLATAQARADVSYSTSIGLASLSLLVEEWSKATGGEVVMELIPARDTLNLAPSRAPDESDGSGEAERGSKSIYVTSLAKTIGNPRDRTWSFRDSDGVLLVRNSLAFIDRTRPLPLGALLQLERSMKKPERSEGANGLYTLNQLSTFHSACTAGKSAALCESASYFRNLNIQSLTLGRFATIMRRLSKRERAEVVAKLHAENRCDIPMRVFSERDVEEIIAFMKATSLALENGTGDEAWIPGFAGALSTGILRLEMEGDNLNVEVVLRNRPLALGDSSLLSTTISPDIRP